MAEVIFHDAMSIAEAQRALRPLLDEGHDCPVCTQFCKIYKRTLSSTSARTLIALYRHGGAETWLHLQTLLKGHYHDLAGRGEATGGHFWGLISQRDVRRSDGASNNGWWRLTSLGVGFVEGRVGIDKYAHVYNGRVLETSGPRVGINDCLGYKFDYRELMGW